MEESPKQACGCRMKMLPRYVFVDTSAYVNENLDWFNSPCSTLAQLARDERITFLTTSITRREVHMVIKGAVNNARGLHDKVRVVFAQLGAAAPDDAGIALLQKTFDEFLISARAVEVPLHADVEQTLADHFALKPPFHQDKKPNEFKDAVVVSSLTAWGKKKESSIYVVCADNGMGDCCDASEGLLIRVKSIKDFVSRTITDQAYRRALFRALKSEAVQAALKKEMERATDFGGRDAFESGETIIGTKMVRIDNVKVYEVAVTGRDGKNVTCRMRVHWTPVYKIHAAGNDLSGNQPWWSEELSYDGSLGSDAYLDLTFDPDKPDEIEVKSCYVQQKGPWLPSIVASSVSASGELSPLVRTVIKSREPQ